eukprot:s966_g4.t1
MEEGSIFWSNLSVTVGTNVLVQPHSGLARAGRCLAVMGPSGAGKSLLLHSLAGLAPANARVSGTVSSMHFTVGLMYDVPCCVTWICCSKSFLAQVLGGSWLQRWGSEMAPKAAMPKAPAGPARSTPPPDAPEETGDDYDMPVIVKVRPDDQLDLSPEELEKEVPPRVLYPLNPRAPHNTTQFSFKEKCFKTDEQVDQVVMHFSMDGGILLKDSPEAQDQDEVLDKKQQEQTEKDSQEAIDEDFDPPENEKDIAKCSSNQFNFSERAAQTKNHLLRDRSWTTQPPPTTRNYGTVTQWEIFDQYMADIEAAKAGRTSTCFMREEKTKSKVSYDDLTDAKKKKGDTDPTYSENMKLSIKIMERMDRSDEFRDGEGTLLPLWRFSSEKAKKKQVTCIKWNPRYNDLCAVGFGSYDFMRQGTGVICCYSLKNTRFPEYVFNTDAGVCCLEPRPDYERVCLGTSNAISHMHGRQDWHPAHPAVLAVGLYDGTVLVYDVRAKTKKPIYQSTVRTNKHTDPVWEVRWNDDESAGAMNFYSISSDGRVSNWFLLKNKLESEEVMELKLISAAAGEDETTLAGLAGGLCFDFRGGKENHLFLVGTEEGRIHKCSKAFSGQYLETYEGHTMAVYTVRWNPFHDKIFISGSADWTVKLWNHESRQAILSFDLAQAIGDVAWAPYSSTTFAAITSEGAGGSTSGVVHLYDLHVDRNNRICEQKVVKRAKLTHVAFSSSEPIIIVGDDRGGVNTLKLSPNLRAGVVRTEDTDPNLTDWDLQIQKMEHLMEMDVPFFSQLTVRETICFAAQLEGMSASAAATEAATLLKRLRLEAVADRRVGERYIGSSGCCVMCRAVNSAAWHSPVHWQGRAERRSPKHCWQTSQRLDTFQAADMVQLLGELGKARHCATILTIHQPRSSVWSMIEDVLLLAPGGQSIFCGPTEEEWPLVSLLPSFRGLCVCVCVLCAACAWWGLAVQAIAHLEALGHACPREGVNPADFLIDLISVHTGGPEAEQDRQRIRRLAEAMVVSEAVPVQGKRESSDVSRLGGLHGFCLLLSRAWLQTSRDKATNLSRLLATAGLGLIFGAQFGYFGEEMTAVGVTSRVGLLSFGSISMAFIGEMRALDQFAKEKKVVGRERAAGCYNGFTYLCAKAVAELPSDALPEAQLKIKTA